MGFNTAQFPDFLPDFLPSFSLFIFEEIPSTNQILWDYLQQGKTGYLVAIAAQQTAGRGQWGRVWQSSVGGLYLSLLLSLELSLEKAPHLTLLSGVGIAKTLREIGIPVQLKWPNDLLLNQKKLGGIKTEIRLQNQIINYAVIGIGINWKNSVPEGGINLNLFPQISSLEQLAALTLTGIFTAYQQYKKTGIEPLIQEYNALFFHKGQDITIEGNRGKIMGVTSQGKLRVLFQSSHAKTEIELSPEQVNLGYN